MKKVLLSTVACATMMLAANSDYKYEITPLIGGVYSEGNLGLDRNYANAGLSVGFNQFDSIFDQVELGFLRSISDVDYEGTTRDTGVTRVFTNLIKEYSLTTNTSVYALAGIGGEFFDDETAGNQESAFGNYGFGLKYKIADELSLKADVRHAIETNHGDSNLLYTVGVAVPFGKVEKAVVVEKPAPVVEKPAPVAAPKDTDGDGVIDNLDQCPDTMRGAKVDTVGCMTLVNLNINFDHDSAVIKDSYNTRINEFAKVMKSNPKLKATIEAHTDADGTDAYNQKLSERRAASTVEALKTLGVEATRIKAVGYGESKPVATNKTAEGKAQNRRVEAVMAK